MRIKVEVPEGGGQQPVRVTRSDGAVDSTVKPGEVSEFWIWQGASLKLEETTTEQAAPDTAR